MYGLTDLKKDTLINLGGVPYRVVEYQHTQLGRGGAVVKTKLKNLLDGTVISQTFKGNDKVEPAEVRRLEMQFLYRDGDQVHLMDTASYEQTSAHVNIIGEGINFLVEGANVTVQKFGEKVIGIDLPVKLKLKIKATEPGARGDTTGAALKPATLETGAQIKVPLFVNIGDLVIVDTRSGSYVSRA